MAEGGLPPPPPPLGMAAGAAAKAGMPPAPPGPLAPPGPPAGPPPPPPAAPGGLGQQGPKRMRLEDPGMAGAVLQQAGASSEDEAWTSQWADVFTLMHEGNMEARAGEYAEAIVALKKNAESLLRQRSTVQASCEQLLHTAYREAMQSHLKVMLEAAATGATQDMVDAAKKTVDDLCPPELPALQQAGPQWRAAQPGVEKLGVGLAQPGVVMPDPKAFGLAAIPSKMLAATAPGAASAKAPGLLGAPLGGDFSQIGQFAAAAAAAQQEAAAAHSNLVVSGLPDGIDDNMFRMLFSRYGTIASTRLLADQHAGFVRYQSKEQAEAAIAALNGFECNGVKLSVRFADRAPPAASTPFLNFNVPMSGHVS